MAEQQSLLEWEARTRPRAATAAFVAAVCTIISTIGIGVVLADAPRSQFIDSLARAFTPGSDLRAESLHTPFYTYYDSKSASLGVLAVVGALGLLALGSAITFLARATKGRYPVMPTFLTILPMIGGALAAISTLLQQLGIGLAMNDFLSGPHTVDASRDVAKSTLLVTAQLITLPATLALSVSIVMVSLNAMRAGLLTRFLGVLGIIVGVMSILLLGSPLLVLLEAFWLLAIGVLFLGRLPSGTPPAWAGTEAVPWPAAQPRGRLAAPDPEPAPEPEPVTTEPVARKRKRKRR